MNYDQPDRKTKELFAKQFEDLSVAFYDSDETSKYTPWDLSTTTANGKRLAFELKGRNIPSTQFDDNFVEEEKVKAITPLLGDVFDRCFVVSLYTDGKMRVTDITRDHVVKPLSCPQTTAFGRTNYVWKNCAIYTKYKTMEMKK